MIERHSLAKAVIEEEETMNKRGFIDRTCLSAVIGLFAGITGFSTAAVAADVSADSLKLAPGVVKAEGYETPATKYIVANGTNVYSGLVLRHQGHRRIEAGRSRRCAGQGERLGMGAGR
jgi:hypothetical protein